MKSGHKIQSKPVVQKAQVCEICGDILVKNHQCLSETANSVTKTCQICNKTMDTKALRHHLQVSKSKQSSKDFFVNVHMIFFSSFQSKKSFLIVQNYVMKKITISQKRTVQIWNTVFQYHRRKEVSHHVCQFCNKSFTTESSLRRHVLIHQNSKPHSCPVCEKTFRQKVALIAHQRVHSGVRFPCHFCSRRFITKSLLTQHQKSCHAGK